MLSQLTPEELTALRAIPLQDVMAQNGHQPVLRVKNHYYYRCPHPGHRDEDASFCVEVSPSDGAQLATFICHGCKQLSGAGAIDLQSQLWGVQPAGQDFWRVVEWLAKTFNVEVQGVQNLHRHYEYANGTDELQWTVGEWTDNALRGLGCKVSPVFSEADKDEPEEATGRMAYSWAMQGEPGLRRPADMTAERLGEDITTRFGIVPLRSFVTPLRKQHDGSVRSFLVEATDTYPIYADITKDDEGRWRMKKYEPLARTDEKGRLYKWTWWYEGGANRNPEFRRHLYGDMDVVDALYNKDVVPQDTSMLKDHPVTDVPGYLPDGQTTVTRKFRRVCICSGPRDALQVYYHSDCHVVYPHSETAEIDPRLLKRLFKIADQVFLLFDADKTGRQQATELNMEYLGLRNVELPEDLSMLIDRRTRKAAKDVSGYFELYGTRLKGAYRRKGIDAHFNDLLSRSVPLQFWKRTRVQSNAEKPLGKCHYNYALDDDPMKRFLYYSGLCKIEHKGITRFALVNDNIVTMVPDKRVVSTARQLMKDWLKGHPAYYDPDLSTRITTSKQILSVDTLLDLPTVELNFRHWGETWDYIFFKNGALKVTPTALELQPYSALPFHVNAEAILPSVWVELPAEFRIEMNPQFEEYERKHRERLDLLSPRDLQGIKAENELWEGQKALWPYKLILEKPMGQMPHAFQYLYDLGRMYWREEEAARREGKPAGQWLSPERQQFQDMQFINKAAAIGYVLSRYRTTAMARMAYVVDYTVADERKATGRTGKSIIGSLMKCVRYSCDIAGKNFKTSSDMAARNFKAYDYLRDGFININDLDSRVTAQTMYNWAEGEITKKNLNQDEVDVPKDMAAKFIISANKIFDLSENSTRGRLYLMQVCDYYHISDGIMEERSPYTKFGYALGQGETDEQHRRLINLFVRFLQFYLSVRTYIEPPVGSEGRHRKLYARTDIKDKRWIEFLDQFFENERVFGQPIPKVELVKEWFRFTGRNYTRQDVLAYAKGQEPGRMLSIYCAEMSITVNPEVVYARPSERNRMPNAAAHVDDYNADGYPTGRRLYSDRQSCYFFYRRGEEPKQTSDVMLNQDANVDVFREGYVTE